MSDLTSFAQHPQFVHLVTTALMGKTHDHLIEAHDMRAMDEGDPDWKRVNAALHLREHRDQKEPIDR